MHTVTAVVQQEVQEAMEGLNVDGNTDSGEAGKGSSSAKRKEQAPAAKDLVWCAADLHVPCKVADGGLGSCASA